MNHIKPKYIFLLLLIILCNNLFSQIQSDSLNIYINNGNIEKAIKYGEKLKQFSDKSDISYAFLLNTLAPIYVKQGKYQEAEGLYLQISKIVKTVLGESNPDYATSLNNLAEIFRLKVEYSKAETLYLQSLEIYKKVLGENHPQYALSLYNLALLYRAQGDYQKAKSLNLESLIIRKKVLGENHPDYATSLHNLASIYVDIGEYKKAETLLLQTLFITKKVLGENHPDYATSLNNLAETYRLNGQYSKAETLYLQSSKIIKTVFGENYPNYGASLNNLALLYIEMRNYQKAEPLYFESLAVRKKVLGENHPDYGASLNNLAELYRIKGEFSKAKTLYLRSLEISKKALGENHPQYASTLNNLALLYRAQEDYQKAESLYLESLSIRKKVFGIHPDYASSLDNLAVLYEEQGDLKKAEPLYLESFAIRKKILGEKHPDYALSVENLAQFYQMTTPENKEKAAFYFKYSFLPFKNQIIQATSYKTINELMDFRIKFFKDRILPLSFLQRNPRQYENISIGCYENELLVKNLSLRNQQRIKTSIEKSGDATLQEKYQQFIENKRYLTKLEELTIDKRPTSYEQLITTTETLEKELVRQSTVFADAKKSLSINWKQMQENLKPNEIAIDLVAYNYYNKKWTDSIVYAAFVVKKGFKAPKYIPLFEQKQLEFLLTKSKNEKDNYRIDKQYSDKAISDLFLKPMAKELENVTTIYLSPSGLGNQIDFSALPVSETQTLGEKYKVHILGSTAEIVNYKVAHLDPKTNLELVLYGNIDYDKSEATNKVTSDTLATNNLEFTALTTRSSAVKEYGYLAGSKVEVNKINALALKNNFSSTIIDDKKATEESIKLLDGRITPFVLHLATHGFFFPDPKQELPKEDLLSDSKSKIFKTADDPMMRSGLLFAGANTYWGKPTENLTTDDGILTASEISNLDLSACQLVVMSACETGLGEINGSEGVFGLQRAFKMAGVKNIIMSLWKVPDVQTAELFDVFYMECFAGKTIHEAFQTAQAKMKAKYSPYYWAGFVLLE
ncbi:CHAT domain-containing protein [Flavobacterium sp. GSP6]|uniref:CHAT domain-containing protein n=1 Tax=Flavobacterium sp. GSP6 TaxID=2497488 RepID=UPI000F8878D0|nr:CHAT domain-containing protein [Flavobacterium sp. GSP6]RTZ05708.1 tetratricopeptide repeat protein [Flavobacterium sp. GSP6]